jgi:hypothetical protein
VNSEPQNSRISNRRISKDGFAALCLFNPFKLAVSVDSRGLKTFEPRTLPALRSLKGEGGNL